MAPELLTVSLIALLHTVVMAGREGTGFSGATRVGKLLSGAALLLLLLLRLLLGLFSSCVGQSCLWRMASISFSVCRIALISRSFAQSRLSNCSSVTDDAACVGAPFAGLPVVPSDSVRLFLDPEGFP